MFKRATDQNITPVVYLQWGLLIFAAGIMNVTAFMGLGTFATHVTGFATLYGVHASSWHWGNAWAALAVPLFFLFGAVISGICVDARIRKGKIPHYDYVMFFCAISLFAACWIGNAKNFDVDQTYIHVKKNFILLSLICLPSGLLNAALSYSSRATLRITHLTGVTTDLGRGIAELISTRGVNSPHRDHEKRLIRLRVYSILCFVLGSAVGGILFTQIEFKVLLIPGAYFLYASLQGRHEKRTVV